MCVPELRNTARQWRPRVACHAVVLETLPPTLPQRHLALFILLREVAHGNRREQEGERATH